MRPKGQKLTTSRRKVTLPLVRAECSLNIRLPQSGIPRACEPLGITFRKWRVTNRSEFMLRLRFADRYQMTVTD